jgi:hypothetical protein
MARAPRLSLGVVRSWRHWPLGLRVLLVVLLLLAALPILARGVLTIVILYGRWWDLAWGEGAFATWFMPISK